jgi:cytochrome c oxidase assembly protein subunit 15
MSTSARSDQFNPWLHRFAVLTALATLLLIGIGGLVTSKEAGMSVPDWPTSYGYNMFALPLQYWTGGVFYEHTHRLWATVVGTLVVALTRWLGGAPSRRWLIIIGIVEILAGFGIISLWPSLKGTGHFLTGIGGVVLLAGVVWIRSAPENNTLVRLGWAAFWLVQFQGLLGGLRVVLFKDGVGIFHGALAQIFFVLLCAIALMTSKWWKTRSQFRTSNLELANSNARWLFITTTTLIFAQLILGATMRHQHAGLAISDFPLAHGQLWPATDLASITRYNAMRVETMNVNSITAFQVQLQMIHRLVAVLIFLAVSACAWIARKYGAPISKSARADGQTNRADLEIGAPLQRFAYLWLGLICAQVALGAATVLTNKAADVATAHVLVGALSLATGAMLCILTAVFPGRVRAEVFSSGEEPAQNEVSFAAKTASRSQA